MMSCSPLLPPVDAIEALLQRSATREQAIECALWAFKTGLKPGSRLTPHCDESRSWAAALVALRLDLSAEPPGLFACWSGLSLDQSRQALQTRGWNSSAPNPNIWIEADSSSLARQSRAEMMASRSLFFMAEKALNSFVAPLWTDQRSAPFRMPLSQFSIESLRRLPDPPSLQTQEMLADNLSFSWELASLEAAAAFKPPTTAASILSRAL